jgi:3-oxoadipate enol-lactonase
LQLPAFAERREVLAVDLQGHGQSARPAGTCTIHDLAADVAGLLAALRIPQVDLVGLSLGGCVGLQFALDFPQWLRRLVLVNTFAALRPRDLRSLVNLAGRSVRYRLGGLQGLAEYIARDLFPQPDQQELYRQAVARLLSNDPRAYRAVTNAVLRFDVRRDLPRISAPTLVIAGLNDHTVPLSAKRLLAARIPNARLVLIPRSGHATPYDQPEVFNRLVLEFLES